LEKGGIWVFVVFIIFIIIIVYGYTESFSEPCIAGQTRYSVAGKQQEPISLSQFKEGMATGKFVKGSHRAFCVLLYYYGVRTNEARRVTREQFSIQGNKLYFNVGKRLKHSKETDALPILIDAPFVNELIDLIQLTEPEKKLFDFSNKTGYNIVRRVWSYPHHFRLTRITEFFEQGRTITQIKGWTGLTLTALNF
jgi:hypothetical protein